MVKKIALGAVVAVAMAVAGVLAAAATKPDTFKVERSATLHAKPETIYGLIADFHSWPRWSPFEKMDPQMKKTYSGAEKGQGAVYDWSGNDQAGTGRIVITEAAAPNDLKMTLDYMKPFQAHNDVEFKLVPQGDDTTVTWTMSGPLSFPAKIMHVFMNMDTMVGGMFEEGLHNLKSEVEKP